MSGARDFLERRRAGALRADAPSVEGFTTALTATAWNRGRQVPLSAYVALAIAVVSIGVGGIFVGSANSPGIVTVFYCMLVAVLLSAGPFLRHLRRSPTPSRQGLVFAVLGGLLFAGELGLWATGATMSGVVNPTLLANTSPLWVGIGAMVLFRERLSGGFWGGLAVAMAGAALVVGLDALRAPALGLGSLLGLLAAAFYGGYFLLNQRGRATVDTLTYFWVSAASTALALFLVALALRYPLTGYDSRTYAVFVAYGIVTHVLGYLAINHAIGHLPASAVAPTMLGQPVVTALLAGPLLGESLTPGQILGGVAVLAGVYVVHRSRGASSLPA